MLTNDESRRESTLLAVIAQAFARGAQRSEVTRYESQLKLDSSRRQVHDLFNLHESPLSEWARSLCP